MYKTSKTIGEEDEGKEYNRYEFGGVVGCVLVEGRKGYNNNGPFKYQQYQPCRP